MIVGDAKQAIYRWRGGEAEQFLNLFNKKAKPFQVAQHVEPLPTNYRSFKEIINFNNSFFKYLSQTSFSNLDYSHLYDEGANQNTFINSEGYIQIDFLDIEKDDDKNIRYPQKVLETIKDCIANGFKYEVAQTKSVSDVVKEQGEYRCYVENYNVMKMNNKRITSTSYMLGFYNEEKQKWTFVEAKEMKASGTIIAYFPDFKTSLNIPENTMKTSDIKE